MGRIIGIDLGTTNSCFAYTMDDKQEIIPNADGDRTTPSAVYMKDDEQLIGKTAKRKSILEPENVIYEAKRFIGRKYDEVKEEIDQVPYKIKKGKNDGVLINVNGEDYKPEQISAFVLRKIKQDAEEYLGEDIEGAVITVPAYFNDSQRNATKAAGEIADLDVKRIINEPTAAALSYGLNKGRDENIAVFDLGGGTFDITILEVGSEGTFQVLATNGDTHLGGADFDKRVVDYLVKDFKEKEGIDLSEKPMALQRLKDEAEKAKKQLSSQESVEINIPFIINDDEGEPKHLNTELTRAKFENLIKDLVDRVKGPVNNVIQDSDLSTSEIDEVLLVGGSTRVPLVKETVKDLFGNKPKSSVNPDEAVAKGAAVQAGILQGDVDDILLLDVTPLSLGVEVEGGMVDTVIPRNTTVPVKKTKTYTNAADNQTAVTIHVLQGERTMAKDNKSLGNFNLTDIPPMKRGQARIEVTFNMDSNGILHVSAKEQTTGKEQTVNIEGATDLSEEEIEEAKEEAEKYAEEDKKKKERLKAKNELESMAYSIDNFIEESEEKLDDEDKEKLQELSKEAKEMTDVEDQSDLSKDELESKKQELENKLQEIYKKIGAGAQGQPGGPQVNPGAAGGPQGPQPNENEDNDSDAEAEVVEGDVEDEDEDEDNS